MAITDLGSLAAGGANTADQTSIASSTLSACAAGELIVVWVACDNRVGAPSNTDNSVASVDFDGVALTKADDCGPDTGPQTGPACSLWWCVLPTAKAAAKFITVTYANPATTDHSALTARHFSTSLGNVQLWSGAGIRYYSGTAVDPPSMDITTNYAEYLRVRGCASRYVGTASSVVFTVTPGWAAWSVGNSGPQASTPNWEVQAYAEHVVFTGINKASDPSLLVATQNANVMAAFFEGPNSGTLAATEGSDGASFSGGVCDGTLEAYEGAVWITADSEVYTADNDVTQVNTAGQITDAAAFTGTVATVSTGVLAATEGADTAAFAGTVAYQVITGTLAATEVSDVASFAGQVRWLATLAATEGSDTAAFTGLTAAIGTLAATESTVDVAAFAGQVQWIATLAATEGGDVAAFTGAVGRSGTLAATEGVADVASFAGQVSWLATLAVTEGADAAAFAGTVTYPAITGVLAAIEAPDVVAITGVAGLVTGTLAATESADTSAFTGQVAWDGTLAATESADAASFAAQLGAIGTLAATEARDVLTAAGYVSFVDEKIGTLDAYESGGVGGVPEPTADSTLVTADQTIFTADLSHYGFDIAQFAGQVALGVVLAATEGADSASFLGSMGVSGTLAAREDQDTAAFDGERVRVIRGVLAAQEGADVAHFNETSPWESLGEGDGLRNEVIKTEWLSSLERRVVWLTNEVEDMVWLMNLGGRIGMLRNEVERITELEPS